MTVEQWHDRKVILGLGNPGGRYEGTRHNRGREVTEELARRLGRDLDSTECGARLVALEDTVLVAPETFMNRSGYAARCLMERRGVAPERMLVVYDEASLALGVLRIRHRGGAGGHNGMASVLECLRTENIPRLRLGIGPSAGHEPESDLVEFVLSPFTESESALASTQIKRAADACQLWLERGTEAAMNRFNGSQLPQGNAAVLVDEEEE